MIEIFYGENRLKAEQTIKKWLGADYEVIDGEELVATDLPNLFFGGSLLQTERRILLKNLSNNKEAWAQLPQYTQTEHQIAIWETKLNKRSSVYKALQKQKVKMSEFKEASQNFAAVFDVYKTARRDSQRALKLLKEIELTHDPYLFIGVLVGQAVKDFESSPTERNRKILHRLSDIDLKLKTTKFSNEPWSLIEMFILELQDLK